MNEMGNGSGTGNRRLNTGVRRGEVGGPTSINAYTRLKQNKRTLNNNERHNSRLNTHRCQCRLEVVGPMCTGRKWSGRPDKGAPGTVDGEAAGETSTGPPRSTTDNRLLPTHTQNTKTKGQFIMI